MSTTFAEDSFTGIILAGGRSTRMGARKALLPFGGTTLLVWQAEKLRTLGAKEILVSGPSDLAIPHARCIPDIYADRGPLGGIHACLEAAITRVCIVLAVDTPLVPLELLEALLAAHTDGVTLVEHDGGKQEPLIAAYDRALAPTIARRIENGPASIRFLQEVTTWRLVHYEEPEESLGNCNTPEEYERLLALLPPKPDPRG